MGRIQCRVCNSEDSVKESIQRELLKGKSYRDISKQFLNFFDCDVHSLEQSVAKHHKSHLNISGDGELTNEDTELLERFREGKVGFDEASRIIASKAFERILRNPASVQVRDWLQSELVRIKRQELENKNNWAMELINRMFSGHLPPENCVICGHPFIEKIEPKELNTNLNIEEV